MLSLWLGVMERPEACPIRGSNTLFLRQAPVRREEGVCSSSMNRWQGTEKDGEARGALAIWKKVVSMIWAALSVLG